MARHHLLDPSPLSVCAEIEHLVRMQSQIPTGPYVAPHSRLPAFDQSVLSDDMAEAPVTPA